jgi:hypothetical protein
LYLDLWFGGLIPAKNPAKRFDRAIIFIRIYGFQ